MNINTAFPSDYFKSAEVQEAGELTLTIASVSIEKLGQGKDAEEKPVLHFSDSEKGLVLNKTNAATIAEAYGPETDAWTRKRIGVYYDPSVTYGGKRCGGIKVRIPNGQAATRPSGNGKIGADKVDEIDMLYSRKGITQEQIDGHKRHFKVASIADLNASQAASLIAKLNEMPDMGPPVEDDGIPF